MWRWSVRSTDVWRAVVVAILVAMAGEATPQPNSTSLCSRLGDGQLVRIVSDGEAPLEARFAGCHGDTLRLIAPAGLRAIPLAAVTRLWVRERHTATGFYLGGILGTVVGGLLGAAMAGLVDDLGGDVDGGEKAAVISVSAVAGGLVFGGAGAIIGTAFIGWREIPLQGGFVRPESPGGEPPPDPRSSVPAFAVPPVALHSYPPDEPVGSLGIRVGSAWGTDHGFSAAGIALGAVLLAEFPGGFGFGGELSWQEPGAQPRPADEADGYPVRDRAWLLGLLVRYGRRCGPVRPYLTAGSGHYQWDDGFLGGSLGAGVAIPLHVPHAAISVEYRYHDNLQNLVGVDPGFHTVTLGLTRSW